MSSSPPTTDLFGDEPPSLQDLLGCARREVHMREGVYPRWVAAGKLTKEKADLELRLMRGIVEYLEQALVAERLTTRAALMERKTDG